MNQSEAHTLALAVEGTLISDATSQIPRPGLYEFLIECGELFKRVVVLTTLNESQFRELAARLVRHGFAPPWFADVEYVRLSGSIKDLCCVPGIHPSNVLLVDDCKGDIPLDQRDQRIAVEPFARCHTREDRGLRKAAEILRDRTSKPLNNQLWNDLIAKGVALKQRVLKEAGGTLSACEVANLLKEPEAIVEQRRHDSTLLAIQIDGEQRYPRCQFEDGAIVAGLDEVLPLIARHPWTALTFLVGPCEDIDGRSPLEALRTKDPLLRARTLRMARLLEGDGFG